jgi:hypothetical protein
MQPSNTKHLGTLASPGARGRCGRRHPLQRRFRAARERQQQLEPWHRTRNRKPHTSQTPAGSSSLSTGGGRDRATHAHAPPPRAANTDSAYYTFWQQILEIRRAPSATPTHVASNHARAATHSPKYRYGQLWNNKLAPGTNSATPTNAHCATKLTEAATSPRAAKTPS